LSEYFDPVLENITYQGDSYYSGYIKLSFLYSQDLQNSEIQHITEKKQDIVNRWKSRTIDLVCSHPHMRNELSVGTKFDIDLKEANHGRVVQMANLKIDEARC
jgi:hypothetical protein